jgi:hypothetical protein
MQTWDADALRSRSVSDVVLTTTLDLPELPRHLTADWAREVSGQSALEPGDVVQLPLARARRRWPGLPASVQAVSDWLGSIGLADVLTPDTMALMACRGARYHHDGDQYGDAIFCNLFVSEDKGQDVHFAATGLRIPLTRGRVFLFDTYQPHGVIRRDGSGFHPADFATDQDCCQQFLTWELSAHNTHLAQRMGIRFDTRAAVRNIRDNAPLCPKLPTLLNP